MEQFEEMKGKCNLEKEIQIRPEKIEEFLNIKTEPEDLIDVKTEDEVFSKEGVKAEELDNKYCIPFVCTGIIKKEELIKEENYGEDLDMPITCRGDERNQRNTHEVLDNELEVSGKKMNSEIKSFNCEHCDYKCSDKSNLTAHLRKHTGQTPFACKHCNYKGSRKIDLIRHERTHTGEKPFRCNECSYQCSIKSALTRHKRTHTGEKPFQCNICEYKCTANSALVAHIRTHTGEKPFKCSICQYGTATKSALNYHMKHKHK